jgi:hypothetical protein
VTDPAPPTGPKPTSTTPLALLVSLGLAAVLALLVVTLSFSTSNVAPSIDGTSVTYSQYFPDGNG